MKRIILLVSVLLALFVFVVSKIQANHDFDFSEEEYPISEIVFPIKDISGDIYMDGGSAYVVIVDENLVRFEFVFPKKDPNAIRYNSAMFGAVHDSDVSAKKFSDERRAKEIVIRILNKYRKKNDGGAARVFYGLREKKPFFYEDWKLQYEGEI